MNTALPHLNPKYPINAAYLLHPQFASELKQELQSNFTIAGDLLLSTEEPKAVCFAQDIWYEPKVVNVQSISAAAKILRQVQKYWYLHPLSHIRRSRLIEAQVKTCPNLVQTFPSIDPLPQIGVFSLLDEHTLIYSAKRSHPWPDGHCQFIEDKTNPPNRAYLKLWEALSVLGRYPQTGETVVDLGASPGGWTYVMHTFGTQVLAIDKAPLAPEIASLPGVSSRQQSAFALEPKEFSKPIDWLLSDVACYPERAFRLIALWIKSNKARQLIITIKLQGETDLSIIKQLQKIPDAHIQHLYNNKHEVTFFYPFK